MTKLNLQNTTLVAIDCINLERIQIAMDICMENIDFGDVKILTHFVDQKDKRIVNINEIKGIKDYSFSCLKELNKYINTEYCLLIQYDGFVTNYNAWDKEFLKYDYIGGADKINNFRNENDDGLVGNGGFSLRSKKLLEELSKINYIEEDLKEGEDHLISVKYRNYLKENGIIFAQKDIADKFASTSPNHHKKLKLDENSFGYHGLNINLNLWYNKNIKFKKLKQYQKSSVHKLKYIYHLFHISFGKIKIFKKILFFIKRIYYKFFY